MIDRQVIYSTDQ